MKEIQNHGPSGDKDMALCGPLQAALDETVNKALFSNSSRIAEAPAGADFIFPEAAILPKSLNTPGMVRQADVLTAIGSQLSARSDTFRRNPRQTAFGSVPLPSSSSRISPASSCAGRNPSSPPLSSRLIRSARKSS